MDDLLPYPEPPVAKSPWKCAGTCGCVFESDDDPASVVWVDGLLRKMCGPCHLDDCQMEGMIDGE